MKKWAEMTTEERDKAATEGRNRGLSAQLIADQYDTTRNAIIGKWNRLKMRDGRWPEKAKKRVYRPVKRPPAGFRKPVFVTVPFLDRRKNQCAWPLWEDGDDHKNCCGNPVDDEQHYTGSYCRWHREISRSEWFASRRKVA